MVRGLLIGLAALVLAAPAHAGGPTLLIGATRPARDTAAYTLAATIGFGLLAVPNAVTTALLPRLAAHDDLALARRALVRTMQIYCRPLLPGQGARHCLVCGRGLSTWFPISVHRDNSRRRPSYLSGLGFVRCNHSTGSARVEVRSNQITAQPLWSNGGPEILPEACGRCVRIRVECRRLVPADEVAPRAGSHTRYS